MHSVQHYHLAAAALGIDHNPTAAGRSTASEFFTRVAFFSMKEGSFRSRRSS